MSLQNAVEVSDLIIELIAQLKQEGEVSSITEQVLLGEALSKEEVAPLQKISHLMFLSDEPYMRTLNAFPFFLASGKPFFNDGESPLIKTATYQTLVEELIQEAKASGMDPLNLLKLLDPTAAGEEAMSGGREFTVIDPMYGLGLVKAGYPTGLWSDISLNNKVQVWFFIPQEAVDSTLTLTVLNAPVNDAPITAPVTLIAIAEDSGARLITQAELLANATDIESINLVASNLFITSGAGILEQNYDIDDNWDGTWTYTSAEYDNTAVSFEYTISDGTNNVTGRASLDITPVNNVPENTGDVVLTAIAEDGVLTFTKAELLANARDVDLDTLQINTLIIANGNGSLLYNGYDTWTYTPDLNDDTDVSFTYNISDGVASVAGRAHLDITPVNDAPISTPVTLAITEGSISRTITEAELLGNASDVDSIDLFVSSLSTTGSGVLVDNGNGQWTYTLAATDNDTGVSFEYTISDGIANVTGHASFGFTQINDAPVNTAAVVVLDPIVEDGTLIITEAELLINASDADGDVLEVFNLNPSNGSVLYNGDLLRTWTYTPAPDYNGTVSFTYSISDGIADVAGQASLAISPLNDAPENNGDVVLAPINEDTVRTIYEAELLVNARDVDFDTLQVMNLEIDNSNGTFNGILLDNGDGTWAYTPALDDIGVVSFIYTISDGFENVAGRASLEIYSDNDAPVNSADVVLTAIVEDSGARIITEAELLNNASDVDGDALLVNNLYISSGYGELVDNGYILNGNGDLVRTWTYTPDANDSTEVIFSYDISDGIAEISVQASLDITALSAPISVNDNFTMLEDEPLRKTAWISVSDAFLVYDMNPDHKFSSTSEITFTDPAKGSMTDLKGTSVNYDTNYDGVLNSLDVSFTQFGIWQDFNANGVGDIGELTSLSDKDIVSLNLGSDGNFYTTAGGEVSIWGCYTFTYADGTKGSIDMSLNNYGNENTNINADHTLPLVLFGKEADQVLIPENISEFGRYVGGDGVDTVKFSDVSTSLSLDDIREHFAGGFEQVDMTGHGGKSISLDFDAVLNSVQK